MSKERESKERELDDNNKLMKTDKKNFLARESPKENFKTKTNRNTKNKQKTKNKEEKKNRNNS